MIDLKLVKAHLNIDGVYDDDYLKFLMQSARVGIENYCDRSIVDTQEELDALADEDAILATQQTDHAELMLIAHWYGQREAVTPGTMNKVPRSIEFMLDPYRRKSL